MAACNPIAGRTSTRHSSAPRSPPLGRHVAVVAVVAHLQRRLVVRIRRPRGQPGAVATSARGLER